MTPVTISLAESSNVAQSKELNNFAFTSPPFFVKSPEPPRPLWTDCYPKITACFHEEKKIPQEVLKEAWKCFEFSQDYLKEHKFIALGVIFKSKPKTFTDLNISQETFDKVYLKAWSCGIITKLAEHPRASVIVWDGIKISRPLSALRSEFFRSKESTSSNSHIAKGFGQHTFKLWDQFVKKNTIEKSAIDLGEALFFAIDINSPSFVAELSKHLSEASKKPGLQIFSRKLDKAANNGIILDIQEVHDALSIDIDNNVLTTFTPKKLSELRKIELKSAYWNFSQLNVDDNVKAQQGFFGGIFKSSINHALDPSLKEPLANFFYHVTKNIECVETLDFSNGIAEFINHLSVEDLNCMGKFSNVTNLCLKNTHFEFKLENFEALILALPNLKEIDLTGSIIKDELLKCIAKVTQLEVLSIEACRGSPQWLSSLAPLKQLKLLNLIGFVDHYKSISQELIRETLRIKIKTVLQSSEPLLGGRAFPNSILCQAISVLDVDAVRKLSKSHSEEVFKIFPESNQGIIHYVCDATTHETIDDIVKKIEICNVLAQINPMSIIKPNTKTLTPVHYLFGAITKHINDGNDVSALIDIARHWLSFNINNNL